MNIDERVGAARPDLAPSDDIVEAHRQALALVIAAANEVAGSIPDSDDADEPADSPTVALTTPGHPRFGRRIVSIAAAAVAVASLGVGVLALRHHDSAPPLVTASTPAATSVPSGPVAIATTLVPSSSMPVSTVPAQIGTATSTDWPRSCTYTDPGMSPISVARALTCQYPTRVYVRGVLMEHPLGNRVMCDAEFATSFEACAGAGLHVVGDPPAGGSGGIDAHGLYVGTVNGGTISLGGSASG